jgi:hypothetical protein
MPARPLCLAADFLIMHRRRDLPPPAARPTIMVVWLLIQLGLFRG